MAASPPREQWEDRAMPDRDLTQRSAHFYVLRCIECGCLSGLRAAGWRGYRIEDREDEGAEPEVGWYCPRCAAREFGVV